MPKIEPVPEQKNELQRFVKYLLDSIIPPDVAKAEPEAGVSHCSAIEDKPDMKNDVKPNARSGEADRVYDVIDYIDLTSDADDTFEPEAHSTKIKEE